MLFYVSTVGVYTGLVKNKVYETVYLVSGAITLLCMLGLGEWLGFSVLVTDITEHGCRKYFLHHHDATSDYELPRCNDYGFIQTLRLFGLISILLLSISLVTKFNKMYVHGSKYIIDKWGTPEQKYRRSRRTNSEPSPNVYESKSIKEVI